MTPMRAPSVIPLIWTPLPRFCAFPPMEGGRQAHTGPFHSPVVQNRRNEQLAQCSRPIAALEEHGRPPACPLSLPEVGHSSRHVDLDLRLLQDPPGPTIFLSTKHNAEFLYLNPKSY